MDPKCFPDEFHLASHIRMKTKLTINPYVLFSITEKIFNPQY